ncbi:MAG: hypothetical protein NVSMB1_01180 [Polyangiales bacterium]
MRPGDKKLRPLSLLFATLSLTVLSHATYARAASPPKIVVLSEGPDAEALRNDALKVMPDGFSVGDSPSFVKALGKAGHKGAVGKDLDSDKKHDKTIEQIHKAAESEKVDAVLIVRGQKDKKGSRAARILLVETKSPTPILETTTPLAKKKKGEDDQAPLRDVIAAPLKGLLPVPEAEPVKTKGKEKGKDKKKEKEKKKDVASEDKEKDKDQDESDDDDKADADKAEEKKPAAAKEGERRAHEINSAIFVAGVGVEFGARRFDYTDRVTKNLRAYDVTGAPMAKVDLEAYPAAMTTIPVLRDFGIIGGFGYAFLLKSAPQGGQSINTTWSRYYVGARERIHLGNGDSAPMLGVSVSYSAEAFKFSADGQLAQEVPSVNYRGFRFALDGRIPVVPTAAVLVGAGYTAIGAGGAVAARFPKASIGGVDAHIGGAITILKGLEARVIVDYRRFFYKMNTVPGDTYVAGGALDAFYGLQLGIAYVY